jgi:hypothetical protein
MKTDKVDYNDVYNWWHKLPSVKQAILCETYYPEKIVCVLHSIEIKAIYIAENNIEL